MANVPFEMLLHPELLTNEQLVTIIQQRHLRVSNIDTMTRDDLLELFHHYCVPYGQRKPRDSGRGKALSRCRHTSPEPPVKMGLASDNQNKNFSHMLNKRLKPPPDLLSGHMKRIKLDTKKINNDFDTLKRKMSVDSSPVCEAPPHKKEKKLITWP
ncbi:ashwin [Papilio machaon]|uniref:ashwin n=1 Tax=Papilio machaon TaxID=76193 RepID=UPI001E663C1F|nr:ashwin [Papilio machaon]